MKDEMPPMKPMFLPHVEANPQASPHADAIAMFQAAGAEYPKILHLFAFRPSMTEHLSRFTQEVMRGEGSLSPGLRELIAAFTSSRNQCPF
jgi:alkylhydroperoxidase family enzyme